MDPEKHSVETMSATAIQRSGAKSHPERSSSLQEVMNERDAITLHQELTAFLERHGDLNEQHAKRLRKSWEMLSSVLEEDSAMRAKLERGFEQLRSRIHRQVEIRNTKFAELEQQLESLQKSVETNDLGTSQQLEQNIIKGLNRITNLSPQRRQHILGTLESLQPKIKKLASWRRWGAEQAREKVIDEIRHIHDRETDLAKIAKRIQKAREEWKQWDLSGEEGDHKLYAVFDVVCTKAYEPCKIHFEQQRKLRLEASKNRLQLCQILEKTFKETDWHQADWKAIQKLVREQHERWHTLGPAAYHDRKPLAKRFHAINAQLNERLHAERTKNLKKRKQLIEKIVSLKSMDDTRQALAELQGLKKEWQVTVSSKRTIEQEVWKQFTQACDAVYARNTNSKQVFARQLESQLEAKQKLCKSIESLIAQKPQDPDAVSSDLRHWEATWEKIGPVPKRQQQHIQKRYRSAMGKARQYLADLNRAAQSKIDHHLFHRAAICAQLEGKVLNAQSPDISSFRAEFDSHPRLHEEVQKALESRFQMAVDAAENVDLLTQLQASLEENFTCINNYLLQLEINAGVESPVAYAKQRMSLQISRLSAAIGKGTHSELLDNMLLIERIHTIGAVSINHQEEIDQRFKVSYQALNPCKQSDKIS